VPVTLCEGDAQALPFCNGTFDTVLSTYSMCTVPDERHAVLEMKRVLKPGGRLILVDHVSSSITLFYWVQRLLELAPSRGDRELTRRPIMHVRDAGFVIDETDRLRAGMIERLVARKP
jgi:ubiquinone/menaquinone biosynthesis C-methylase UbiE